MNQNAKDWLRIDLGHELEPTVEWLRGAIERQLGGAHRVTRLFVGCSEMPLPSLALERSVNYFTFGQLPSCWHDALQ